MNDEFETLMQAMRGFLQSSMSNYTMEQLFQVEPVSKEDVILCCSAIFQWINPLMNFYKESRPVINLDSFVQLELETEAISFPTGNRFVSHSLICRIRGSQKVCKQQIASQSDAIGFLSYVKSLYQPACCFNRELSSMLIDKDFSPCLRYPGESKLLRLTQDILLGCDNYRKFKSCCLSIAAAADQQIKKLENGC